MVQTFEFEGAPGHVSLQALTFEERDGRTTVRTQSVFQSVQARDAMVEIGHGVRRQRGFRSPRGAAAQPAGSGLSRGSRVSATIEEVVVEYKLEVVVVPVSDVDRSKAFYSEQVGFVVDVDYQPNEEFRVVQLTPPGSGCSITIGKGLGGLDSWLAQGSPAVRRRHRGGASRPHGKGRPGEHDPAQGRDRLRRREGRGLELVRVLRRSRRQFLDRPGEPGHAAQRRRRQRRRQSPRALDAAAKPDSPEAIAAATARIDATLERLPADQRAALEALRETIAAAAPGAVEGISYGMPAFRYRGHPLVGYQAAKAHCALYPMDPAIIEAPPRRSGGLRDGKGDDTLHPRPSSAGGSRRQDRPGAGGHARRLTSRTPRTRGPIRSVASRTLDSDRSTPAIGPWSERWTSFVTVGGGGREGRALASCSEQVPDASATGRGPSDGGRARRVLTRWTDDKRAEVPKAATRRRADSVTG